MKQTSWLSGLSAVRRPRRAAWARTSALVRSPTGNVRARELRLAEHVQHVRLVLRAVGATRDTARAVGPQHDARVVAGGDRVDAERGGPSQQPIELEVPVALDARVGRAARGVVGDVGRDDLRVEVVAEVEHVVVDAELVGDASGVVDVGDRAAAGVALAAPQLHRDAGDAVAPLDEQRRGDRRVDAARHRDDDLSVRARAHANAPAILRSCATAAGTASSARSTSAAVDGQPSESRSEPCASSRLTPMAASTCDGSCAPLAHDDAADA